MSCEWKAGREVHRLEIKQDRGSCQRAGARNEGRYRKVRRYNLRSLSVNGEIRIYQWIVNLARSTS